MTSIRHKEKHSYRLSYQQDVGSSFDPDMEDMDEWERFLKGLLSSSCSCWSITDLRYIIVDEPAVPAPQPDDFDEAELAEYAAEHELLEGLDPDEIFGYSDLDDLPVYEEPEEQTTTLSKGKVRAFDSDDDMQMD